MEGKRRKSKKKEEIGRGKERGVGRRKGGGGGHNEREMGRGERARGGVGRGIYKEKGDGWRETGLQARSKDQEILEEGGGAGPSLLPRRDHE